MPTKDELRYKDPERRRVYSAAYRRSRTPEMRRAWHLRHAYGLEHDPTIRGRCGACGSTESLVCDHNHSTNKFRDVLCNSCNAALGQLQESPLRMIMLAQYAERHQQTAADAAA